MQQNESDNELQPLWYEKLGKWQQALAAYEHRAHVEARRLAASQTLRVVTGWTRESWKNTIVI